MRSILLILLVVSHSLWCEDITTKDGKTYKNAVVEMATPEGVVVTSNGKQVGIKYANLTPEQRFRYKCEGAMATAAKTQSTLKMTDAFSLAQLEAAKKKAVAEGKPIGLILVWPTFFGQSTGLNGTDSNSALAHFHHVFKDQMVLVFIRHEEDQDSLPSYARTFGGEENGHVSPSMCVLDSKAEKFICQVPYASKDRAGREVFFRAGIDAMLAAKDLWIAAEPAVDEKDKTKKK